MRSVLVLACVLAGSCTLDRDPLDPGDRDAAPPRDASLNDGGMHEDAQATRDAGSEGGVDAGPPDAGGPRVLAVAAGRAFTCALRSDGVVRCWGENGSGQLGDGSTGGRSEAAVTVLLERPAVAIAAGGEHACALLDDGSLACWGENGKGQVDGTLADPVPEPAIVHAGARAVALGGEHSCLIDAAGTAHCWGKNGDGQLGLGNSSDHDRPTAIDFAGTWVELALGAHHTCGIDGEGALWCWGKNGQGQLGDGSTSNRNAPVRVLDDGVTDIGAGAEHSCSVRSGAGFCWGKGADGRLGTGDGGGRTSPAPVFNLEDAITVDGGLAHSCALRTEGRISCWGKDDKSQLGPAATGDSSRNQPIGVSIGGRADALAVGAEHSCAIVGADVWCWGNDGADQLGSGASGTSPRAAPVDVPDLWL